MKCTDPVDKVYLNNGRFSLLQVACAFDVLVASLRTGVPEELGLVLNEEGYAAIELCASRRGVWPPEKVAIAEADTETHLAVWRHYKVFPKESK